MSEISDLPPLTNEQIMQAWTLLEPIVQATITLRLHQFHDGLVKRGQILAVTAQVDDCIAVEMPSAHSAERAGCSAADDGVGSSLVPLPGVRVH